MNKLPERPLTFEEAGNVLDEMKKNISQENAQANKFQPTVAPMRDQIKYSQYCIGLLKDKRLQTLLKLRLAGWSYKRIAWEFAKCKPEVVEELEKIAIEKVKLAIDRTKNTGIPLLGGAR